MIVTSTLPSCEPKQVTSVMLSIVMVGAAISFIVIIVSSLHQKAPITPKLYVPEGTLVVSVPVLIASQSYV